MTKAQMDSIDHRRIDDTTREMMVDGVTMTHDESDEISDAGHSWLETSLGLVSESTDEGMAYSPRPEWSEEDI